MRIIIKLLAKIEYNNLEEVFKMIQVSLKKLAALCEGTLINVMVDPEVRGVYINTRTHLDQEIFIPIVGPNFDAHDYVENAFKQGARVALFQRDHDHSHLSHKPLILVDDTTKALQTLAKNYRESLDIKVVGITGSNGKTSSKDILFTILNAQAKTLKTIGNLNNEIGVPLTLLNLSENDRFAIIEMGMSALNEIDFLGTLVQPDIAMITSIGHAHVSDVGSLDNVMRAKLEIINHLKPEGTLVVNGDNLRLLELLKEKNPSQTVITYGVEATNDYVVENVVQFYDRLVFYCEELSQDPIELNLLGEHQALNATGAILVALQFQIPIEEIIMTLTDIELTSSRLEVINVEQAIILDDSYKSNPQALAQSLKLLNHYPAPGKKIAVLGDMLDLGEDEVKLHQDIGKLLKDYEIDRLYTLGELAVHFAEGNDIVHEHFDSLEQLQAAVDPWLHQPSTILFKASNSLNFTSIVDNFQYLYNRKKVAVICGGKGSEYLVSLSSTYSVMQHFPKENYELVLVVVDQMGSWWTGPFSAEEIRDDLWKENPEAREIALIPGVQQSIIYLDDYSRFSVDVFFNMMHGKYGEDGVLPALLQASNFKYTGCDLESSILCYDKDVTHRLLDLEGVRKAKYRTLTQLVDEQTYEDIVDYLGVKQIIKPAREGSSYGISVAEDFTSFNQSLAEALRFDSKVVVEEFINGVEIGCSVLEYQGKLITGECDEIELHTQFFDYDAKYSFKDAQIHCPARISEVQSNKVKESAKLVFKLLGCRDFARVDYFLGEDGHIYFNEINTIPGFTSHSRFPSMMDQVGISYGEIITTLIENALSR